MNPALLVMAAAQAAGGGGGFSPSDIAGLRAWWDADNYSGSGTTWPDVSGNGLDLTLVNSPTWSTHAVTGHQQFEFRGASSQYATVADNALLDFAHTDDFSLVVIAQHSALATGKVLAGKRNQSNGTVAGYNIATVAGVAARSKVADGATQSNADSAAISTGALYLHGLVHDVTADQVHSYVDNTKVSVTDNSTATFANSRPFRVNSQGDASAGNYADFDCLAVLVYAQALTDADIANLCTYYGTV
jgi:hypothetical protein